jgi:tetratricopeptide (TPR) repeat protein
VIFLDDLHWCDRPSLALLEQVARGVANQRIVIVGTYRDVEVDRVHPLAQTLAALRRMEHHERIALRGFTQQSVVDLLTAIEPSEVTGAGMQALAQVLHEESEGNPFFIREVLNNLVESGKLVQRDGVWVGTVESMDELGIPEGIKEVVGRRLSRLSDACNRMLGHASAMTGGFTWDELRSICDDGQDDLLDALDDALGAQLIAERERNTYAFTHALIRATLYDELSTPRRVQLHRRIAEALERLHAGRIDEHLPELAHHFFEAASGGDLEKAIDYCMRASDAALAAIAYEDAVRHLERALSLSEMTDDPDGAFRCELLLQLGDAQARAGNLDGSDLTFDRAGQLALSLSRNDMLVRAALGAQLFAHSTGSVNVVLLEAALDRLEPGDSIVRARCMARLSPAFAQDARGAELARGAVAMAERLGDTASLMHALASLHRHLFDVVPDRVQDRIEVARRLLALAEQVGDREMALTSGHCNLQGDLLHLGEMRAADVHIAAHARLSEELRQGAQHGHTIALQAMRAQLRGQYADADNLARAAFEFRTRRGFAGAEGIWLLQRFAVHWDRGSLGEFASVTSLPPIWDELLRGLAAVESGERPAAPELLDRLAADSEVIPVGSPVEAFQLAGCAELCSHLAHTTSAPVLLQRLARYEQRTITLNAASVVLGAGARYLGMLEVVMGDWEHAERHMEMALDITRRLESPPWIARTQHDYARMLLVRGTAGDRERAQALNAEALATARELGMRKVAADCERLMSSLT